jgi:hypothetical protein
MKLSFFSFTARLTANLLNPEIKYNFSDSVWAAVGANIFGGGDEWNQFGQLHQNDNMYTQIRYEF